MTGPLPRIRGCTCSTPIVWTFVNLIDNHGAAEVMDAMDRLWHTEDTADVVISAAHKAKGRE